MKTIYTHYATYHGVPCYFNYRTGALKGRNWFYEKLIDMLIGYDFIFPTNKPIITAYERLEAGNTEH